MVLQKEKMNKEMLLIIGPCAAESPEQIETTILEAQRRGISHIRASLWKPRTRPGGFEGLGLKGLGLLEMIADHGLTPATEVISPQDAEAVVNNIVGKKGKRVLIWTGARTGVGLIIKAIAKTIEGEPRAGIMVKNPMEQDTAHWMGMMEYAAEGCQNPAQIWMCHRGFWQENGPLRNPPDINMALCIRENLRQRLGVVVPLIFDPSHVSGRSDSIKRVTKETIRKGRHDLNGGVNGLIIEVHPNPAEALTDRAQQLSWFQFDNLAVRVPGIYQNLAVTLTV